MFFAINDLKEFKMCFKNLGIAFNKKADVNKNYNKATLEDLIL